MDDVKFANIPFEYKAIIFASQDKCVYMNPRTAQMSLCDYFIISAVHITCIFECIFFNLSGSLMAVNAVLLPSGTWGFIWPGGENMYDIHIRYMDIHGYSTAHLDARSNMWSPAALTKERSHRRTSGLSGRLDACARIHPSHRDNFPCISWNRGYHTHPSLELDLYWW